MAVRDIVIWPDPRLREQTRPVETFDEELRELLDDMVESMYAADGVGLAAPQIGVGLRIFVVDTQPDDPTSPPVCFVNPQVLEADGETLFEEGCLSVPGEVVDVPRKTHLMVEAVDGDGRPFQVEAEGLLAIALQHELDHLDGRLIVDHLSSIKRDAVKKRMLALKAE